MKELRRQDRLLTHEQTLEILQRGKFGVLSILGDDGYPYGVPMHYVMLENSIYVHSSNVEGHKLTALKQNSNICFTVVESENGIQAKSVILFGQAKEVLDKRQFVVEKLVEKFVPECAWEQAKAGIPYALDQLTALEITWNHICGKWIDKPEGK